MILFFLILGLISLAYASYLHIYYQRRGVRTEREVEVEKFKDGMQRLGMSDDDIKQELRKHPTLADISEANKKLNKALKKYKSW